MVISQIVATLKLLTGVVNERRRHVHVPSASRARSSERHPSMVAFYQTTDYYRRLQKSVATPRPELDIMQQTQPSLTRPVNNGTINVILTARPQFQNELVVKAIPWFI